MFGISAIAGAPIAALTPAAPEQDSASSTTGITVLSSGDGTAHENMPPFFTGNWIIKT